MLKLNYFFILYTVWFDLLLFCRLGKKFNLVLLGK